MRERAIVLLEIGALALGLVSCSRGRLGAISGFEFVSQDSGFRVESSQLAVECGRDLGLRAYLRKNGRWVTISSDGESPAVTSLRIAGKDFSKITLVKAGIAETNASTLFGEARRVHAVAEDPSHALAVTLTLDFPARYPDVVVITSEVKNLTPQTVTLEEIDQASLALSPGFTPRAADEALFWSLQGGGYKWGGDYILPVRAGFTQDNYTGPKGQGNGGGFPFVDLWRPGDGRGRGPARAQARASLGARECHGARASASACDDAAFRSDSFRRDLHSRSRDGGRPRRGLL